MDTKNLTTFIITSELGSFTRAAEKLGCSQSTVSFQIKQLENELGIPLFERVGHTIALTERGKEILKYAQQINHIAGQMKSAAAPAKTITGHIRIAIADSLIPVVAGGLFTRLHKKYPGITLQLISAVTHDMFRMLDHNEVDFIYTSDSHIYDLNYTIVTERREGIHFVCGPENPLVGHGPLSVRQLMGMPFILTEHGMSYRRLMDEKLATMNLQIRPVFEVGNPSTICQLLSDNVSLSFLPDYATRPFVDRGELVRLEIEAFDVEIWTQLLYHREKWLSPQMLALIDSFR